jgi:hypothetical protein
LLACLWIHFYHLQGWALGFDAGPEKPPTEALRPIFPDNASILCLTVAAVPFLYVNRLIIMVC